MEGCKPAFLVRRACGTRVLLNFRAERGNSAAIKGTQNGRRVACGRINDGYRHMSAAEQTAATEPIVRGRLNTKATGPIRAHG